MFFVIIYSVIDQGYIGLSLASCHKDEIWDLRAELGLIWDHFRALVPIGTKSQIWDIITSTVFVIWIFSFPRPNFPKPRLFSETKFFETKTETFFRNQIFQNRDFFPRPNFSETETFFLDQIFQNRKQFFFRDQIFRNRNFFPRTKFSETEILKKLEKVSKSKCQSLISFER